jgi:hypothetical protein
MHLARCAVASSWRDLPLHGPSVHHDSQQATCDHAADTASHRGTVDELRPPPRSGRSTAMQHDKTPGAPVATFRKPRKRLRRAAGTRNGWDLLKAGFRPPKEAASRADIEAIERGEGRRTACFFRGTYEPYPRKFIYRKLDLTSTGVTLRPLWFTPNREPLPVDQSVTAVHTRPRNPSTDRRIKSSGNYRPDGALGWAGFSVVVCETPKGQLEFAVPNPDVPLVIRHFQPSIVRRPSGSQLAKRPL